MSPEEFYLAEIAASAWDRGGGWPAVVRAIREAPPYVDPATELAEYLRQAFNTAPDDYTWRAVARAAIARGAK